MTSIALSYRSLPDGVAALVQLTARGFERRATAPDSPEDARNRRAFLQEMLSRNPEAFSSELDVQGLIQHYSGSF